MGWLVGVDVGGTFTDFFACRPEDGATRIFKRPSTPHNPGEAIVRGLQEMAASLDVDPARIDRLCHGTTVATNALIQRRGGTVALVTTEGFRDLLEIGRQTRPHMYSLQLDHPAPLVPRRRRFEIRERMGPAGEVLTEPDEDGLTAVAEAVAASGAQSCAVCCLFSFVDPAHERRIADALKRRLPDLPLSLSSSVRPEFREYERFSTTVLNACLQPVIADYLAYLETETAALAPDAAIRIYQSSGGLMSVGTARTYPIRTALSGPAAGAVGAVHTARGAERPNVITLDMGGTSADVALIRGYDAGIGLDREVAGYPVRQPMVDIHTVGAGGGSIAWFERDGLLKVGPRSAGAEPGPACYGRGGTEPTVTDANLALGRLSPAGLAGGDLALDEGAARRAIEPAAQRLGFSVEKTAQGILGIVVANMVRAVRTISVERGLDPRDYALMPFGGAGPLHAVEVARVLGIREIVVPGAPGILCAQGLIVSDLKEEFVRSGRFALTAEGLLQIAGLLDGLEADARAWFDAEGVAPEDRGLTLSFDARYVGQNFELPVSFAGGSHGVLALPAGPDEIADVFHAEHERHYGFHSAGEPIEIVNIRIAATGRMAAVAAPVSGRNAVRAAEPAGHRPVWFDGDAAVETPVYWRESLAAGMAFAGPAVVEQLDSTTVVFPGDRAAVDEAGNLVIAVGQSETAAPGAAP
ncbi:MAG: hydantoinase/oxoprolinase family protein [Rhodospirillaceae bacterium]|nr:hydantoinase/oxoprolinase family protein [Rhodospirillaceae bacterium]